jgi:hypothetical protein
MNNREIRTLIGFNSFFESIGLLILGLLLLIPKNSRTIGTGILMGCGITLSIAVSLCSIK